MSESNDELSESSKLEKLEKTLESFQENIRQMGVICADFTVNGQEALNTRIHTVVSGLQEINSMRNEFEEYKVPIELLDMLDVGQNPMLFTKASIEKTNEKNAEVNGKVEIYKKFQATLIKKMGEEMPEETAKYRSIRMAGNKTD